MYKCIVDIKFILYIYTSNIDQIWQKIFEFQKSTSETAYFIISMQASKEWISIVSYALHLTKMWSTTKQ